MFSHLNQHKPQSNNVLPHQVCAGDWLPTSVFGYLHALCAYLRMIYVALYLIFLSGVEYDVVFCDQVSFVFQEAPADAVWFSAMTSPVCRCGSEKHSHCQ